jgi:polyhydroxybutyrate depolymerase
VTAAGLAVSACSSSEPEGSAVTEDPSTSSSVSVSTPPTSGASGVSGTTGTNASAGCNAEATQVDIGTYVEQSRVVGDSMDTWMIRLPKNYSQEVAAPLVFNFHGAGSNPKEQVLYSNFDAHADEDHAILVAPKSRERAWSPLKGPDAELIDYLLAEIPARYCVDLDRVFSTGMSSGAFTHGGARVHPPRRVCGLCRCDGQLLFSRCMWGTEPIDIMTFHGTADPIVEFGNEQPIDGIATEGGVAARFATGWSQHNGCDPQPEDTKIGSDVTQRVWAGCEDGGSVTFYVIDGGGHTWPGAIALPEQRFGATTTTISATDLIWEFFMSHSLGD